MPVPLFILAVLVVVLLIVGFLAGPIGSQIFQKLFNITLNFPDWLVVKEPEVHLPAPVLFHIGSLGITNTMLATWLTVIFLVVGSYLVTRRLEMVPGRMQAIVEFLFGWLYDFCKEVAGEENGRKFFPVIATIFLFVMFNGWLSLIPGFGPAIYAVVGGEHYELLRGANTDINTPLAIAIVSFLFVWGYGFRVFGFSFFKQYFNFGGIFRGLGQLFTGKLKSGLSTFFSGVVDAFVGMLELLSVFIRIVSFTFRLFGNMLAGEILILIAAFLIPFVLAIPFYGLELLVGFVQALIFGGLTLVFVTLAVTPHETGEV